MDYVYDIELPELHDTYPESLNGIVNEDKGGFVCVQEAGGTCRGVVVLNRFMDIKELKSILKANSVIFREATEVTSGYIAYHSDRVTVTI